MLDVSRRKSGNYTVRRPLEMGAAMAGCDDAVAAMLGGYGDAIGEAFQMRDDLLGIFGSPSVTGKPSGSDLSERKATTVVAAAYHLADRSRCAGSSRELMSADDLDADDVAPVARPDRRHRCRGLDRGTDRLAAHTRLTPGRRPSTSDRDVRTALADMAAACTERAA